jgi:acetyl-CoA acyltransferase
MASPTQTPGTNGRRAVIVAGLRTPFVKSGTVYKDLSTLDLAKSVVAELMARLDLDPGVVDSLIYGQVVVSPQTPNIAREVVFGTGLPRTIEAYSVSRACATSTQALVEAAQSIMLGNAEVVICGGADSLSKPPITYSEHFSQTLMQVNNAKEPMAKARALLELRPRDLVPNPPALKEAATGLTMGESAEKMAKENGISREAQDELALRSHQRAARAWENGVFAHEVMRLPVPPDFGTVVARDAFVRADTTLEKLASLKPAFDKKHGTVTAGNSSALTDGASAMVVMSEDRAKALGLEPLAYVRAWGFAGVDPSWQLLGAPPIAAARALARAGLTLADMDLVDMHEAFAAQVLSNLQAMASRDYARRFLGRDEPLGELDPDKLNIHGGSIALGHPFGATGVRQATTMANELERRGSGKALITQCAAGAMGAALVLER